MGRVVSTALVVALLAATAAAFALTEGLKLEQSPILGTSVPTKVFSPVCDCETATATIRFRIRTADTLDIQIVDRSGEVVRTIVPGRRYAKGPVAVAWDGLDDGGALVPEGTYKPRVRFRGAHRTIELPNPIRVDVTAPRVLSAAVAPRRISPDGDRRRDRAVVRYRLDEPGRAQLFVNGKRRVVTRFARERDQAIWYGVVDGRPVRAGRYALSLRAVDRAGNVGEPVRLGALTVRYVSAAALAHAVQGRRFRIRVETDAARYAWRFAGGRGTSSAAVLSLRAPRRPGFYTLFVEANGHAARTRVLVRAR